MIYEVDAFFLYLFCFGTTDTVYSLSYLFEHAAKFGVVSVCTRRTACRVIAKEKNTTLWHPKAPCMIQTASNHLTLPRQTSCICCSRLFARPMATAATAVPTVAAAAVAAVLCRGTRGAMVPFGAGSEAVPCGCL